MLSMALAGRVATDWAGDAGAVVDFGVRFTRPVVVPDDGVGARLAVGGSVLAVDLEASTAVIDLVATCDGAKVMARSRVTVRLADS
jgi:acyl dehydratase